MFLSGGEDVARDVVRERKHFVLADAFDLVGGLGTGVGDPDVGEPDVDESLPAIVLHDSVGDGGAHFGSTSLEESVLALERGSAGVDQIVDDDDVVSARIAFAHRHDRLLTLATDLAADDEREELLALLVEEETLEALPGAFVGEADCERLAAPLGFFFESSLEKLHTRLGYHADGVLVEVMPNRKCVEVHHVELDWTRTCGRQSGHQVCEGAGRRNLTFLIDPLHGSRGEVGEEDSKSLRSDVRDRVHDAPLLEHAFGGVHATEQRNITVAQRFRLLHEGVLEAIWKTQPVDVLERNLASCGGNDLFCHSLHARACEQYATRFGHGDTSRDCGLSCRENTWCDLSTSPSYVVIIQEYNEKIKCSGTTFVAK